MNFFGRFLFLLFRVTILTLLLQSYGLSFFAISSLICFDELSKILRILHRQDIGFLQILSALPLPSLQRLSMIWNSVQTSLTDLVSHLLGTSIYRAADISFFQLCFHLLLHNHCIYQKSGSHEPAPGTAMSGTFLHISRSAMPVFSRSIP